MTVMTTSDVSVDKPDSADKATVRYLSLKLDFFCA